MSGEAVRPCHGTIQDSAMQLWSISCKVVCTCCTNSSCRVNSTCKGILMHLACIKFTCRPRRLSVWPLCKNLPPTGDERHGGALLSECAAQRLGQHCSWNTYDPAVLKRERRQNRSPRWRHRQLFIKVEHSGPVGPTGAACGGGCQVPCGGEGCS